MICGHLYSIVEADSVHAFVRGGVQKACGRFLSVTLSGKVAMSLDTLSAPSRPSEQQTNLTGINLDSSICRLELSHGLRNGTSATSHTLN